jgi:calcium-dependent protein kinase
MGCGIVQKKITRTHRGSIILFPGQFVQNLPDSIYTFYEIKESLGSGSYGTVVSAVNKESREPRAIKIINKYKLHSEESRTKVINEVLVLRKLDHPHIVKIFEFYEDEFNLYVVMELCRGGELLDMIIKIGSMNEADASHFMQQVFSAVFYMHSSGIVHRDLKLENMLLDNSQSRNIKIVDFGTACEFVHGKKLSQTIGTVNYIAPEIFKKKYDEKCDMWSCGVIMYILLTGKLPFAGKDKKQTIAAIARGQFSLELPIWEHISPQAKALVKKLLELNPGKRISAQEAVNDAWVQKSKPPIDNHDFIQHVISNLSSFGDTSKFQRAVIRYIVSQLLSQGEKNELIGIFKTFDSSGDGKINQQEFIEYCKQIFGAQLTEDEIKSIMSRVDTDNSGFIDYSEFLAAAMDRSKLLSKERLRSAFEAFDRDKNGKISAQELKVMLEGGNKLEIEVYNKLIREVDQNEDNFVDFKEFLDMMSKLK